jgi:putative membrane protein
MRLLVTWVINALALLALPYLFHSIHVASFANAMVAALVLGLINTLIRPILVVLTLPVTILTLGLFIFVINGLLFWFVGSLDLGFTVDGFWTAVLGAVVYSVISWVLSSLVPGRKGR